MRKLFLLALVALSLNAQNKVEQKLNQILAQQNQIIAQQTDILQILKAAAAPDTAAAPTNAKVDVKNAPVIGDDKAPMTIVEFTDFQCPFCQKFHTETYPQVVDKLVSTGKVRFVSKDFPLPAQMHPNALQAAEAGRCAGDQAKFWEMRNWMQSNPDKLDLDHLKAEALDLRLDMEKFGPCVETGKYRAAIQAEVTEETKLGINGTPAFVIGKSGETVEGPLLTGAQPFEAFEKILAAQP